MKTDVYVVKCASYDEAEEKIGELLALMGGMGNFAKAGEKITLKANLLSASSPDKAITTHPAVVAAIGALVKKEGALATIADSPGTGYRYSEGTLRKLYKASGMDEAAKQAGIEVNMDTGHDEVSFPNGKQLTRMKAIRPVTRADGVINICKMKTHMLMHMTGAVKNSFGIIPGISKIGFHAKLLNKGRFADMLLDLSLYVSPRLSVMDAVLAMEGDGPGASGTPRHVGLLLASGNPLAVDVVAGEIMGLPREHNPVLIAAEKRGLTPNDIKDINVIGEDLRALRIPDYKFTATVENLIQKTGSSASGTEGGQVSAQASAQASGQESSQASGQEGGHASAQASVQASAQASGQESGLEGGQASAQYPVVLKDKCIGCGICQNACPQKTITISAREGNKRAEIDTKNCILCYCCHEMCPHMAIDITKAAPH